MEELFAPPELEWRRLSPGYRTLLRVSTLIWVPAVSVVAGVVIGLLTDEWWIPAAIWVAGLVLLATRWAIADRRWRSWGYVEREDDLYITHGVLFRSLVAVPYGRMQLVEVGTGPLQRALGLATVTLVTAAAATDASIPGLTPAEATRLRDRLTELGEARSSGL
ncbi:PH domain-containing protein [Microlunatus panaciterrae]|uniref:Membrane protein YdbS with pleckstrin-like domain n=1 Tax=Microlunatus panaciterrae TaxID=400768 RepID=A0ABS2RI26_9ACTN|nr:PH domain-containing protein [Microlunatus panaciterrae]MBM7798639.1 membrane protein YdbS with pleckstrin-like domain [Microlunatus panaciterrae]